MFDTTALGDGPWRPVPMRGPKVLYRSVSVPELLDICRSGTIRGGMNRFNPADRRPLVFFADTLDDRLISQGEHIHRQAYYAAESSQEHLLCEFLRQRIREHGTLILGHLHCDGVNYTEDQADGLPRGESYGRLKRALRHHEKYRPLFLQLAALKRAEWRAWEEHGRLIRKLEQSIERRNASLPITSAVLVTRPIGGGLLYTTKSGCGLGEREYGLRPGQVRLQDIERIILFKDRRKVASIAEADISKVRPEHRSGLSPAFPCKR